jgi:hypothetical protein
MDFLATEASDSAVTHGLTGPAGCLSPTIPLSPPQAPHLAGGEIVSLTQEANGERSSPLTVRIQF